MRNLEIRHKTLVKKEMLQIVKDIEGNLSKLENNVLTKGSSFKQYEGIIPGFAESSKKDEKNFETLENMLASIGTKIKKLG